jgi:hypothetical protein
MSFGAGVFVSLRPPREKMRRQKPRRAGGGAVVGRSRGAASVGAPGAASADGSIPVVAIGAGNGGAGAAGARGEGVDTATTPPPDIGVCWSQYSCGTVPRTKYSV